MLAPLRVAWLAEQIDGVRAARFIDLVTFGDPRDPGRYRQKWLLKFKPERCVVVTAEPGTEASLRARWRAATEGHAAESAGFPEFVARQAHLALERAERTLRGARYKVPRFVDEEMLSRADFLRGEEALSKQLGRTANHIRRSCAAYLKEIAANHSPFVIDLVHRTIGLVYRQGYGAIHYSQDRLKAIYADAQRYPLVFLPTHKSNLDHLLMQYLLHENNFPPNHTAGGINMNFFPVGPLFRRTGVFFIRRTFKDNPVYKFVLRQYVDYLVEKRFPLEWYMEGGRSRTGKLLPPRLGMLAYVVDAWRRGKSEDVIFVPVSIAYDQISDVGSYVSEQQGAKKEGEGFGWMVRTLRGLRRRYGNIHVSFGETLSLAKALGTPDPRVLIAGGGVDPDEKNVAVQKIAFEMAVRVNRVTPLTATALVALVFLGEDDRAMTVAEVKATLADIAQYVKRRALPTTRALELETSAGIERALVAMVENGVFKRYAEGREALYGIAPNQHLAAAYYRNTVVHFFVSGAIAELSLLAAAERREVEPVKAFWDEAMRLRDLLKFEFFFPEKEAFRAELRAEVQLHAPGWEVVLESDRAAAVAMLRKFRPYLAHRALRTILEAYWVVAETLVLRGAGDEAEFLAAALSLGRQYLLQRRIHCAESVSKTLFQSALGLARNQNLVEPNDGVGERRKAFASEFRDALRRADIIDTLQAALGTGII